MTRDDDDSVISFRSSSTSSPTVVVHSTTSGTSERKRDDISRSGFCHHHPPLPALLTVQREPVRCSLLSPSECQVKPCLPPATRPVDCMKRTGELKSYSITQDSSLSAPTRQITRKTIKSKSELLAKTKHPHPPVHPLPLLAVLSFLPSGGW